MGISEHNKKLSPKLKNLKELIYNSVSDPYLICDRNGN